jgi:hypothetical protein
MAIVFSLISCAAAATSPRMLGDVLSGDDMVKVHFDSAEPEDVVAEMAFPSKTFAPHDLQGDVHDLQRFFDDRMQSAKILDDGPSEPRERESFFDEALGRPLKVLPDHEQGPSALDFFDESPAYGRPIEIVSDHPLGPQDLESFFDEAMSRSHGLRGYSRGNGFRSTGPKSPPEDIAMMRGEFPNAPASISASTLRNLFPGPGLMFEENGALENASPMPFGTPDMAVMDMLQQMDDSFARDLLPIAHRAASAGHTPDSCGPEIRKYCPIATSKLHCLGKSTDKISEKCRADVGKSVPFLCSKAIDKWCNLLDKGILDCLGGHLQNLEEECHDAVVATRHVVLRTNTQRASVTNPLTGTQKVNVPIPKQNNSQREAQVDAQLSNITSPGTKAPTINAKHVDHQVSESGIGFYKADGSTKDSLSKTAVTIKDSGNSKSQVTLKANNPTADYNGKDKLSIQKENEKTDEGSEAEVVLISQSGRLVFLFMAAGVSIVLLRSQRMTKLLATHNDPAAGLPLVRPRMVDKFVVASGNMEAQEVTI